MVKALFFDLDGTLLNSKRTISQQTRLTLEKCKERGIRLFIATARPPLLDRMLSWDENTLSLFDGDAYYNGGCIKIGEQKDYQIVSDEIVQKTINCVCEYDNLNVALQLDGEKHAFSPHSAPLQTQTGSIYWLGFWSGGRIGVSSFIQA